MSTHPLETYLADCRAIRATGANAPETSFYPALSALLKLQGVQGKYLDLAEGLSLD